MTTETIAAATTLTTDLGSPIWVACPVDYDVYAITADDIDHDPAITLLDTPDTDAVPVAWKYADPTEDGRWIYSDRDADRIAAEDPALVVPVATVQTVYPTVVEVAHPGVGVDADNRSLDLIADGEWVATLASWTETDHHFFGQLAPDLRAAVEAWAAETGRVVADWTDHAELGDGNEGPAAILTYR